MVIAAIGFAGSYAAVRELAERKGFGEFAPFFPIGVDAGIVVLLSLDLLLTWIRIPFPLLRQTAWLLTAATIAFNGAAAWPDPLGVGMHAVIPVLFVVTVEAARHAAGRVAAITADKHMEGVRLSRWLLAFPSTFRLWRRMKLWELRNYDEVIRMEQDRLVYETRLRAQYGRSWRRKAPVEALMPLKLARYGVPLAETAPSGLAAAGLPADSLAMLGSAPRPGSARERYDLPPFAGLSGPGDRPRPGASGYTEEETLVARYERRSFLSHGNSELESDPARIQMPPTPVAAEPEQPAPEERPAEPEAPEGGDAEPLRPALDPPPEDNSRTVAPLATRAEESVPPLDGGEDGQEADGQGDEDTVSPPPPAGEGELTLVDRYYLAWADLTERLGAEPGLQDLSDHLWVNGMTGRGGGPISPSTLRRYRLGWRIYRVWVEHLEALGSEPPLSELEALCAKHGIKTKGDRGDRLDERVLAGYLTEFRRRYAVTTMALPH
ncbi:DUF2637 domain-containing protein [Streptomyces sp. CA-250714]|uniref:DUF2637 domain-containing protein n=1 Tax=Streptomyces sp. CA-250714 TaxID=3240060 RepID=UPI003D8BB187